MLLPRTKRRHIPIKYPYRSTRRRLCPYLSTRHPPAAACQPSPSTDPQQHQLHQLKGGGYNFNPTKLNLGTKCLPSNPTEGEGEGEGSQGEAGEGNPEAQQQHATEQHTAHNLHQREDNKTTNTIK